MIKRLLASVAAFLIVGFSFTGVANAAPDGLTTTISTQAVWWYEGTYDTYSDCRNAGVAWVAVQGAISWTCRERSDLRWDLYILD
ncbi:hypothetical protein EDD35_6613 [Amycolatopsis thermoflava]|uniref:Secreted protein n=1 Tax=Amycolatopsis thermoflava TaxID=84480 RepID=A0A3N2H5I8_9PSEU|nr:hypothetical protein EDD35_6613 [Amycolatopsis thermoflava]